MTRCFPLRHVIGAIVAWSLASVCAAGQAAPASNAPAATPFDLAAARDKVARTAFVDWTAIQGPAGSDPNQFVTGATTVRGIALSVSGTSTFSKYAFPLKLTLSPFALDNTNRPATGIKRSFRDSNLDIQYKVLTYEQHETKQPDGTTLKTKQASAGQAVALGYKVGILNGKSVDDVDFDQRFATLIGEKQVELAPSYLRRGSTTEIDSEKMDAYNAAIAKAVQPMLDKTRADLANQFQLSLKPGYTKSWAPSSQDDASLTLSATKGWAFIRPAPATTRVATLSADLGNTSSLERGDKGPHAVVKAGVSGTIDLTTGVTLGMQAVANQNSGVGFTGIPGVTDTTRRNEVNLSQSLVFKLAGGQPVTFSIQENHLGTGSRDIAITTDLGYKLPPLTPRAKKP